jgi:hypothetical protein
MAEAVPSVPFTESGGVDWPMMFSPQQTATPLPA